VQDIVQRLVDFEWIGDVTLDENEIVAMDEVRDVPAASGQEIVDTDYAMGFG
jgi:hypothetical protein